MASDESDDEPLALLAVEKRANPEKFAAKSLINTVSQIVYEPKKKKRKCPKKTQESPFKKLPLTFELSKKLKKQLVEVIQRPADVWLYLKDFNPSGPYNCLLCSGWFINRAKMILHYVLNHQKDFCGICRYFVPDREAWVNHSKFHTPWACSQCGNTFDLEPQLREHLSSAHSLVHCRLCHFRLSEEGEVYKTHLQQKHNATNLSTKDNEIVIWECNSVDPDSFLCLLCMKPNILSSMFFNHFMGFHHFTLKCFSMVICGRDIPFTVNGADVSPQFNDNLKDHGKYGYGGLDPKLGPLQAEPPTNPVIPEVKTEIVSDSEDIPNEEDPEYKERLEIIRAYKGDKDFDVTLVELIVLQDCYFDYVQHVISDLKSNIVTETFNIDYEKSKPDVTQSIDCVLCNTNHVSVQAFSSHMCKMHHLKITSMYSCRVCGTTFDTQTDLDAHIVEELGDFDDLWICQFCDKEFDDREPTRRHLNEHWSEMDAENCFSPHLGFKCKYCPILFWNEADRETHQIQHFDKYKEYYYKCSCSELFSDMIWFVYHYLQEHLKEEDTVFYLLKCQLCCIVHKSMEDMRAHFMIEHPDSKKLFCSLDACQYRPFSHKKSFQLHLRSQHTKVSKPVNCSTCGRTFPTSRACNAHAAQAHGSGKYVCKICKDALHSLDERKLHYLICHPGQHPYECSECGKSFLYKSSLYMHKQEHLPNKQTFTCSYCQKVFAKKDSYREHLQIHEGPRHSCSYCPMRFVQRSNMLRHERRHTGERPYACPHCARTFADKGACTSHVRTHTKETSFACLYCGQTFAQKSKLTYHIRKHTGENLETCPVCSKLFTSMASLREHMKIHDAKNNKMVKCPLCDRTYQDERYMLRHLRTSHTNASFLCPICKKAVTSASGLRHHVVTHSQLNIFRCKCCPKSFAVRRSIMKHLRKRHGMKGDEANIKDFYHKLDPRDCELNLPEEVMTSIFGPKKNNSAELIVGDYVTIAKKFETKNTEKKLDEKPNEEDEEESEKESEEDKAEGGTESEGEIEPTDFVSVKIEPIDYVED